MPNITIQNVRLMLDGILNLYNPVPAKTQDTL